MAVGISVNTVRIKPVSPGYISTSTHQLSAPIDKDQRELLSVLADVMDCMQSLESVKLQSAMPTNKKQVAAGSDVSVLNAGPSKYNKTD